MSPSIGIYGRRQYDLCLTNLKNTNHERGQAQVFLRIRGGNAPPAPALICHFQGEQQGSNQSAFRWRLQTKQGAATAESSHVSAATGQTVREA